MKMGKWASNSVASSRKLLPLLSLIVCVAMASIEFDAQRLIQYTTSEGETFGSLSSTLNFAASHYTGDIFRKVALIHFNELILSSDPNFISKVFSKNPLSILFILPRDFESAGSTPNMKLWEDVQMQLTGQAIDIPVYFSFETEDLVELYKTLRDQATATIGGVIAPQKGISRMLSSSAEYIMFLNVNEPKLIPSISLDVIYVLIFCLNHIIGTSKL